MKILTVYPTDGSNYLYIEGFNLLSYLLLLLQVSAAVLYIYSFYDYFHYFHTFNETLLS